MSVNISEVLLTAKNLCVSFGEQVVLDNASLSIHDGDCIGLVGRNGTGKSTFLKIISGLLEPNSGEVVTRNGLVLGYLSQEFILDNSKTVYENILDGAQNVIKVIREYENLPYDSEQRQVLEERILHLDGWTLDNRIKIAMQSLNAPEGDREIYTLSGGEKRRVALCRAIISKPDLLILDEPTNHLDTESIEWTEDFLANFSGACLFVTHDRYFLDRIANRIVELASGVFYSHSGNYTDYLINKAERESVQEVEEQKRASFLRSELEWVRRGPRARRTKSKSRLDTYFKVAEQRGFEKELDVDLIIPEPPKMGTKVLNLKNVSGQIGGKLLFEQLDLTFEPKRRLGIVGRNGLGKTTLLKLILGELEPLVGKVEIGESIIFNYVDQARLILNENNTVFQEIGEGKDFVMFGSEKITIWKYLKKFLFTDDRINSKIERLSGGEKSRLMLAKILKQGGNFLLLDEPTNDLDLPTLRILEEALARFEGCVIVVSHDRYFLNRVCTGILAFEGNGKVYFSEGDYDYYLEKKKARVVDEPASKNKVEKKDTRVKTAPKKLKWAEAKELEQIEEKIMEAESEVERIQTIFSTPDFYEKYGDKIIDLNKELEQAKLNVQALYDRWDELEEKKNSL
jgi:ABC transport system ATP-binding/permease protein